jgi:hypothetical protein
MMTWSSFTCIVADIEHEDHGLEIARYATNRQACGNSFGEPAPGDAGWHLGRPAVGKLAAGLSDGTTAPAGCRSSGGRWHRSRNRGLSDGWANGNWQDAARLPASGGSVLALPATRLMSTPCAPPDAAVLRFGKLDFVVTRWAMPEQQAEHDIAA